MAERLSSVVCGDVSYGLSVGYSYAPIQASFHYPPGTLPPTYCSAPSKVDSADIFCRACRIDPTPIRVDPLPS